MTTPLVPTITSADGSIGNVALSWTTSAGATSYNVQRQDPGQGTFHSVATGLTTTNFTDTTVGVNSTYTYEVQAVNGVGMSAFSPPAVVIVQQPLSAPSAPTNLQTDVSTENQVILNWTAGMGAASYRIERQNPGAGDFTEIASGVTSTSFVDTNVV